MARHAVALVVLCCLVAGSTVTATEETALNGHARFFGPLAAGCQVEHWPAPAHNTTSNTTTPGQLESEANTTVVVFTCTDTFTGQPIPYPVAGVATNGSSADFQVSSTNTIAAAHNLTWADENATMSYEILGLNFTSEHIDSTTDVFALLKSGAVTQAEEILAVDLQFIAVSTIITKAILNATNYTDTTCNTSDTVHAALTNYVFSQTNFSMPQLDASLIGGALASFGDAPCNVPADQLALASDSTVVDAIVGYAMLAGNLALTRGLSPVSDLVAMSRLVSFLQSSGLTALLELNVTDQDAVMHQLGATTVQADQICAAIGIDGYVSTGVNITVAFSGPLNHTALKYRPFTELVESTLPTTNAAGVVLNQAATLGFYVVPAGAIDTLLTTNTSSPVTTLTPFQCIAPFTSHAFVLTPVAAMVLAKYLLHDVDTVPSVPTAASWKDAYDTLYGGDGLPNATDYLARNYTQGSAIALSIAAMDGVLPAVPNLGGVFIASAANLSDATDVVSGLYAAMLGKNVTQLCNNDTVATLLSEAYHAVAPAEAVSGRRLQTVTMDSIFSSISAAVAQSSAMAADVLATAKAAIAAGTEPDATLFTKLAQIAKVQNTDLATAIQAVADAVSVGDLNAAADAAAVVESKFTGDALASAVAAATINDAVLKDLVTPPATASPAPDSPSPSPSSPEPSPDAAAAADEDKHLGVGLGVGLGAGIPVVGALVLLTFLWIKKRRASQTTVPAAPDSAA